MPDRPQVELPVSTERPTIELEPMTSLSTHRYSVRRAVTEDERSQMVERVALGRVAPPAPKPTWRVEHHEKTVVLRNDTTSLELSIDDARKLAEAILRGR